MVIGSADNRDRVVLWRADSLSFRLWLNKKRGDPGSGFGVWLPFDRFFAERAALATAFWRAAADPPVSSAKFRPVAAIPPLLAVLRRRTLRALIRANRWIALNAMSAPTIDLFSKPDQV